MDAGDFLFLLAFSVGMAALGVWFCLWLTKKAGIKPGMSFHKKLFYDNCTGGRDSRRNHRSWYYSKKGGKLSIEVTCTRGTLFLEFCTEDGQVLQTWRNGDPAALTVELPPKKRVYWRSEMNHFSGSLTFR